MICLGFFSFYFLFSFFHLPANTAASSLPSQFISAVWQDQTVSGSGRESLMDARNNSRKNSQFSKKAGSLQAFSQMSCSLCCLLEYQIIEIHFYSKIHIISGQQISIFMVVLVFCSSFVFEFSTLNVQSESEIQETYKSIYGFKSLEPSKCCLLTLYINTEFGALP